MAPRRTVPFVVLSLSGLVLLGGCVDAIGDRMPEDALRWEGVSNVGDADAPGCGALAVEVAIVPEPNSARQRIVGRAYPADVPESRLARLIDETQTWWVEGYLAANDVVSFEIRQQGYLEQGTRPYGVWRGGIENDIISVTENGSLCDRVLQLRRA